LNRLLAVVTKLQPGIRSFAGHTERVPDMSAGSERHQPGDLTEGTSDGVLSDDIAGILVVG